MGIRSKILWIDGWAAFLAGIFVFLTVDWLNVWYLLPRDLLIFIATVNLCYASFSLTLALVKRPNIVLVILLVAANSAWSFNCLHLAINHITTASFFGLGYLVGEAVIVGTLACCEWRWRKELTKGESVNV